jgi:hypothetical protein
MEDSVADTVPRQDTPLPHRAAETSAEAVHSPHPRVGLMADAPSPEAAHFTEVAGITAAEDIMALVSDSVSAFTPLTDMLLRSAIPPDSTMQTACGKPIRVALCRTDIKLDGKGRTTMRGAASLLSCGTFVSCLGLQKRRSDFRC